MIKSYIEQMKNITSAELVEGLVGHGLFSNKIPPFLSSEYFFNFCKNIELPTNSNSKFINQNHRKDSNFIQYENIRNINIPRILAIPEPVAYYNLCQCLADNWDNLCSHFEKYSGAEKYKRSRIHIRKIQDKKQIFIMNDYFDEEVFIQLTEKIKPNIFDLSYRNIKEDGNPIPKILIGKKYLVNADISNCFNSIYTHAFSWALVGKEKAKNERSGRWHNEIDKYAMNLTNGETHGILIGPHASNLLSEIILVVIDKMLCEKEYDYIRNIDDYSCYVESREQAEQFLIDLSNGLKEYGLSLNHKKTKIQPLPLAISEHWVRKLNKSVPNNRFFDYKMVQVLLDTAIELMSQHQENSAILNYAIKTLSGKKLSKSANKYYIEMIHHLVLLYPYLIQLLDEFIFEPFQTGLEHIKKISNDIYEIGYKNNSYEAIGYALFFSIKYNFKLKDTLFDELQYSQDAVALLLGYMHDKKFWGLYSKKTKEYKKLAKSLYLDDADKFWIFTYEVLTIGNFKKNSDWYNMKQKNISFLLPEFRS